MVLVVSMTPVMYSDISGYAPEWWNKETLIKVNLWMNHTFLMWMADDYNDIASGDVRFVPNVNGGGQIENSHKVQNPVIVLWYSYKLRSEYGDNIDGSPQGIAAEWMLHNVLFDGLYLPSNVGLFRGELDSAAHTDIGRTVFHENRWYVLVPTVAFQYSMNRSSVIIDFAIYISSKDGE
jgi:hypothetical protein